MTEYNQAVFLEELEELEELENRVRDYETILREIANLISRDDPPKSQLRDVASLLYENEVRPQFVYTLRNWPEKVRDVIASSCKFDFTR